MQRNPTEDKAALKAWCSSVDRVYTVSTNGLCTVSQGANLQQCLEERAIKRWWQHGTPNTVGTGTLFTINMARSPSAHSYCIRTTPVYKESDCLLGQDFQCALSIAIREKSPFKYLHIIVVIQTDKNKQSLVLEKMWGKCTCIHCWWEWKQVQPFGRWFGSFCKILKWAFTSAQQFCFCVYILEKYPQGHWETYSKDGYCRFSCNSLTAHLSGNGYTL